MGSDCDADISQADYVFLRCSQTTTCNAHLIPTSAPASLSAPSTYRQKGANHKRGEPRPKGLEERKVEARGGKDERERRR